MHLLLIDLSLSHFVFFFTWCFFFVGALARLLFAEGDRRLAAHVISLPTPSAFAVGVFCMHALDLAIVSRTTKCVVVLDMNSPSADQTIRYTCHSIEPCSAVV